MIGICLNDIAPGKEWDYVRRIFLLTVCRGMLLSNSIQF